MRGVVGFVVLSSCLSACGEFGAHPECPARGGTPWHETVSERFTVVSDLPRTEVESTARGLEEGLDGSRFVVVHDGLTPPTRKLFFHERTHDLIARNLGATPPWLNEGWAQYYSTLRVEGGYTILGEPEHAVTFTTERTYSAFRDRTGTTVLAIPIEFVPAPSAFLRMSPREFYGGMWTERSNDEEGLAVATRYAAVWAFVHMLVDGSEDYRRRFAAFYAAATAGRTFAEAFRGAFGDLPPGQLDRDFRRYLASGEIAVLRTRYESPAKPFALSTRPLTDAEVHLYWARLARWKGASSATALRDLDAASAAAPSSPEPHYYRGLFALAQGDLLPAERELALAMAASPDEPRFLFATLLLRLKQNATSKDVTNVRALTEVAERLGRVARTPNEMNAAAEVLRRASRCEAALVLAERAAALAPYNPAILDTYANVLFDLDRVAEAIDVQTAAVSFLDEHTKDDGFSDRLRRYKNVAP